MSLPPAVPTPWRPEWRSVSVTGELLTLQQTEATSGRKILTLKKADGTTVHTWDIAGNQTSAGYVKPGAFATASLPSVTAANVGALAYDSTTDGPKFVNNAGSWVSITALLGTLGVASGGTGAVTFPTGRLLFGNGTSPIGTDANLYWDQTNHRLSIGSGAAPAYALDMTGSAAILGTVGVGGPSGGAPSTTTQIQANGVPVAGATQNAFGAITTWGAATVTLATSFLSNVATLAAAFVMTKLSHFRVVDAIVGAGSSITTQVGFDCPALSGATTNVGFLSAIVAGANNYAFRGTGTAKSSLGGDLVLAGAKPGNSKLLRSDAGGIVDAVTIGAGIGWDGTNLTNTGVTSTPSLDSVTGVGSATNNNIKPSSDGGANLGTSTVRYNSLFVNNLYHDTDNSPGIEFASVGMNINAVDSGGTIVLTAGSGGVGYIQLTSSAAPKLNFPTSGTVGAAGGGAALPLTPTGYLQVDIGGTVYKIPYYPS